MFSASDPKLMLRQCYRNMLWVFVRCNWAGKAGRGMGGLGEHNKILLSTGGTRAAVVSYGLHSAPSDTGEHSAASSDEA